MQQLLCQYGRTCCPSSKFHVKPVQHHRIVVKAVSSPDVKTRIRQHWTYKTCSESTVVRHIRVFATALEFFHRTVFRKQVQVQVARWLAAILPELGPTYVKIGQFVSTREDIFGADVSGSFRCLQDDAPRVSFDEIQEIINLQGPSYAEAFETVEIEPIASASIAQVHRATLKNGTSVVLKIKRPNLDKLIECDLIPLKIVIDVLAKTGVSSEALHAKALLRDFVGMMMEEVDFEKELRNNIEFQKMYALRHDVIVPRAVPRLCTKQVVVMEYIESNKIFDAVTSEDDDFHYGEVLAYRVMTLFVGQVLYRGGVIHGDPQPGNIGVTDDGKLVLYDFGSALRLSEEERTKLKLLMYNIITGNSHKALAALKSLGVTILDEDLALSYMRTYAIYVRTMDFRAFQTGRTDMPFALTDTLLRLVRIFGILEGMCKKLYAKFDYTSMAVFTWDAFVLDAEFVAAKGLQDINEMW